VVKLRWPTTSMDKGAVGLFRREWRFPREEARVEDDDVARPDLFTCMCKD